MRSPEKDGKKIWFSKPFIKNTVQKQKEWKNVKLSQKILTEKNPNINPSCPQIPAFFFKKKNYCLGLKIFL